ncbi:hypothetical protein T11_2588 [Trichinella zimbabwensis]|uniref:Uncharacterized protein n=1 Tax=Trichinella zimbabwensis TaxID=268475 RepID=A0A0V1HAD3_9BILA|nr:hypothetical protein T11_2588 [Trichinella zimbabwensis]
MHLGCKGDDILRSCDFDSEKNTKKEKCNIMFIFRITMDDLTNGLRMIKNSHKKDILSEGERWHMIM